MKHLHYHVGQMEGRPEPLQPQTRHPNLSVPRGNPLSMLTQSKKTQLWQVPSVFSQK